jgi:hypothetical protein
MNRDFLVVGDEMYEILRKVKESNSPVIEKWREITRAEKVYRKDGFLFFCRKVEDPDYELIPWDRVEQELLAEQKTGEESAEDEINKT